MQRNKGFTLVEVIVAMTVGTFVVAAVVMILHLAFSNYKTIRLESELQIEAQTLGNRLETILKGAERYKYEGNILSIKSNKIVGNEIVPKYYYFIFKDGKSYLVSSDSELENIAYDDANYLSNFVDNVTITPDSSDTMIDNAKHEVTINIEEYQSGVFYSKDLIIRLRQGEWLLWARKLYHLY